MARTIKTSVVASLLLLVSFAIFAQLPANSTGGGGTGTGTVTNVTGTANQVSVATGTTTPVISLPTTVNLGSAGVAGNLGIFGATSGSNTISAPAVAGSGTTFTLPNASGVAMIPVNIQNGTTPVVGTAVPLAFHSYTVPANTIPANGCMQFQSISKHTTGSASVAYTFSVGGVSQNGGSSTAAAVNNFVFDLCNTGSTSGGTQSLYTEMLVAGGTNSNLLGLLAQNIASTSTIAVTVSFNVAATDQVTPILFKAVLFQ